MVKKDLRQQNMNTLIVKKRFIYTYTHITKIYYHCYSSFVALMKKTCLALRASDSSARISCPVWV